MKAKKPHRLIRRPEVEAMTGMTRTHIYAAMEENKFPKSIQLMGRAVAWVEAEVQDWIDSTIKKARTKKDEEDETNLDT